MSTQVTVETVRELNLKGDALLGFCEYISELEANEYGGPTKSRKADVLFDMINKCPDYFLLVLVDKKLVGYCDLWQLKSSFYSRLLSGEILEEEISAAAIVAANENTSNCWYFGSLIILEKYRAARQGIQRNVFWQVAARMRSAFDDCEAGTRVMAVGSTAFGQDILRRNGFHPVQSIIAARDTRPRFQKIFEEFALSSSY